MAKGALTDIVSIVVTGGVDGWSSLATKAMVTSSPPTLAVTAKSKTPTLRTGTGEAKA